MAEIFKFLDSRDHCLAGDSIEDIIEKFDLCISEAEKIYRVWKQRYMVPKVEVDYMKTTGGFYRGGSIARKNIGR